MSIVKFLVVLLAIASLVAAETKNKPTINESDPNIQEICSLMPPNKYILRPHTCTNWVKCPSTADGTDYEEGSCVAGLFFNKDVGRCDYEDNVQCPYIVAEKNRCEGKSDEVFLPDTASENCRGYVYCRSGKEMRANCPSDLVFDPKQAACVYSQDYKCPSTDHMVNASPICRSIASHQLFANEEDCSKYYECDDEALLTHECDLDMAFDFISGNCVQKDNVVCHTKAKKPLPDSKICGVDGNPRVGYFSDGNSCSGYYICKQQPEKKADRQPVHMVCEPGLFFDETKWSCRDRLNVRCSLDRCEGMNNKYVNIAGDCSSYARCGDGITVATGHCPTNYFFDERTQGCTPQNINYIACAPIETN